MSTISFFQSLAFVFALVELYVLMNIDTLKQVKYGLVILLSSFVFIALSFIYPSVFTSILALINILCLFILILRVKLRKKNQVI